MSAPPPYPPNENPDKRQLPPGWITQFDSNYKAWFYVNTQTQPPVTTWVHPLGAPSSPPPNSYGAPTGPPPPGPPPPDRGYGPGPGYGYNSPSPGGYPGYGPGPGYQSSPPPQGYYNGPPQNYGGGYQGGYAQEDRGLFGFGRNNNQPQYPPQQTVVYEQAPPKKSGPGMGTMLAVGGAGLLGGALLGEAIEHHEDEERFDAYQDGYDQGRMDDFGPGGDDFGGDW